MRFLLGLLRHHWGKVVLAAIVATAGIAMAVSPYLRGRAHVAWDAALMWAGLTEESVGTDDVFWCPMHPQIKSNKENYVCPICNMALVELEGGIVEPPQHLTLTAQQIQQAGVVSQPVLRQRLYREIDTTGRIDYDERRYAGISSWVAGKSRIERLHVNFTFDTVEQGQIMAEIYSPDLITAQEEYLVALQAVRARQNNGSRSTVLSPGIDLVGGSRQKLLYQGMTDEQVKQLASSGKALDRIPVYAPISGTVIERHIQQGQYVNEGDWLFHLADLSHLWLYADIYEDELALVSEGLSVELSVKARPGETFEGIVAFIDPKVDPRTRTVRVRVDVANPDGKLMPGMFAGARIRHEFSSMLAVPENSVLWSGQRSVVLVKLGGGGFQPREVKLGKKWLYAAKNKQAASSGLGFADQRVRYHEVVMGLSPGDEVVTSGAFLLNAESQFQSVLAKMLPPESQQATFEQVVGEAVATRFRELLDAYFKLSAALADDKLEPAGGHIESLTKAANSLTATAKDEDATKLVADAAQFETLAKDLSATPLKDFQDARTRFGRISRELSKLLHAHGGKTLIGKDVYQFECGMAKVGYERWLWWSPEIHNPYMGQRMLDCGRRLDVFEP